MKVLVVSYSYSPPDFGGELFSLIDRLETLSRRGLEIRVLTAGRTGYPRRVVQRGLTVTRSRSIADHRIGKMLRLAYFVIWSVAQILLAEADVAHVGSLPGFNSSTKSMGGLLYSFLFHVKHIPIVYVHSLADTDNVSFEFTGVSGRIKKCFLQSVDTLVCVSPRLYDDATAIITGPRILLIPYGIRDDIFVPLDASVRNETRTRLGYNPENIVFCFVGSVGYRKGFDLLAQVFSNNVQAHPEWRLLAIGPNNRSEGQNVLETEVASVTAPIIHDPRVMFLGRIDDKNRLAGIIAACDVFVFPSRREGMGIAPVEAMAAGLPAIVTKLDGITDIAILADLTGVLIPVGNADALSHAMVRLSTDNELRFQMGMRASEHIRKHFGWEEFIDKWDNLYRHPRTLS